jgi:hypothetical protein
MPVKSVRPVVWVHHKGTDEDRVEYVRMPGETPDGMVRWVIPLAIHDGDTIALTPWPPDVPTTVLCEMAGTFRTMFTFRPGDFVDPSALLCWDWLARVVYPAQEVAARTRLPLGTRGPINEGTIMPTQPPLPDTSIDIRPVDDEQAALIELIRNTDDPVVLWWIRMAAQEAQATVAKAREYGSAELQYAGHVIGRIGGRDTNPAEAMELQIFHYCLGKMGRWTAAVTRGQQVSDDTLFDMGVYCRMVQRIRETGQWP